METFNLFLCKVEKDKRTRIAISLDDSLATCTMVTCYSPTAAGSTFCWDIKNLCWHFEDEAQRRAYIDFIAGYQKEEKKFFKAALADALQYKRKAFKQKKQRNTLKLQQAKSADFKPMLSREEVLLKIVQSTGKC